MRKKCTHETHQKAKMHTPTAGRTYKQEQLQGASGKARAQELPGVPQCGAAQHPWSDSGIIACRSPKNLDSQTWDGRAVRPAELSQAQAHGPSEAGRSWTQRDTDGVRDAHRRGGERERERGTEVIFDWLELRVCSSAFLGVPYPTRGPLQMLSRHRPTGAAPTWGTKCRIVCGARFSADGGKKWTRDLRMASDCTGMVSSCTH